jgi:hypothetical protein
MIGPTTPGVQTLAVVALPVAPALPLPVPFAVFSDDARAQLPVALSQQVLFLHSFPLAQRLDESQAHPVVPIMHADDALPPLVLVPVLELTPPPRVPLVDGTVQLPLVESQHLLLPLHVIPGAQDPVESQ